MLNISTEAVNVIEMYHSTLLSQQPTYLAPISAIRYQPKYTNFQICMAVMFWGLCTM